MLWWFIAILQSKKSLVTVGQECEEVVHVADFPKWGHLGRRVLHRLCETVRRM